MKSEMEHVVDACRRKDARAQKRLYDEYAPKMLGVCMRYTHSRDEAQDLLHDGFIKIFETINTLQNPAALENWMNQIMVRTAINYITRNREIIYADLTQLPEEYANRVLLSDTIDPKTAQVVRTYARFHHVEIATIARRLHKPESTIRSTLARARRLLRKKLQNEE